MLNNAAQFETINLLLVEDDEIDVEIFKRRLQKENISNPLFHALDGVEALDLLRGHNNKSKLSQPYVILVDINMPRMNGLELLKTLREDPELKKSVVFMLTTSGRGMDRDAAYNLSVAGYFLKNDLDELVMLLGHYWHINKFPENMKASGLQ